MPCDEVVRVFSLLWLQQQDKEGAMHCDPCGGYQEIDNKQDDDLHDSSICPGGDDDSSLQVEHLISQDGQDSYSGNCHYSW